MWKLILVSFAALQLTQAFDIDGFVKKFCVQAVNEKFICQGVRFTTQELENIQKGEFVISHSETIEFNGGDIGHLNEHFLKKFPSCTQLVLREVKIKLDQSLELINHPVESMVFESCEISGIKDSQFFQHLQNLKNLFFMESQFDHSVLSKHVFGDNSKLVTLVLEENDFSKIDDNALEGLQNLEYLVLSSGLEHISPHLLSGLNKLKSVNLSRNQLSNVPCDSIPENVEKLHLRGNGIHSPSFKGCKFLESLKELYMGGNGIEILDESVFKNLRNLEVLYLDYNKLKSVSNDLFKDLNHLKRIKLAGNAVHETNIRKEITVEL